MKFSFQYELLTSLVAFLSVLFIALGIYYYSDASRQLYQEMSGRAKIQAEEVALMPNLHRQVSQHDPQVIRAFMQQIVARSDASFIVIDDCQGVHLFHPVHPEWVGTRLVGGDNQTVLEGRTITIIRKGSLGVSLRSKTPIVGDEGQMIGIVFVGYLTSCLGNITLTKVINIFIATVLLLIALFTFPRYFTHSTKKQAFSPEPREIGPPVCQQKAVMESILGGAIVIDHQWRVEVTNHAARSPSGLSQLVHQLRGQSIDSVISPQSFFVSGDMLERDTHDELCRFNQLTVLASRVRTMPESTLQDWVITFHNRSEINAPTAQLSQVKHYADNLRIMRHEQLNRVTALSSLLHMSHYDEATRYIQAQSEHTQELLDFISSHFYSPTLCGLLLGEAARTREKGVALSFDPACCTDRPLSLLEESELISIIGNLLNSATEAMQRAELSHEPAEVLIQLNVRELIIEVADRGAGIRPDIRDRILERGVTTKTRGDHGIGLYLIEHYAAQAGGITKVVNNASWGTIFILFISANVFTCLQTEAHNVS